ncbi:hypothetical protein [Ornithinimicrobium avium]|uniref:Uncharacterized protein n=1 Tax=Ornithinimicrobium avium TaxID=2283195 RepID=A0A345NLA5_9MICO|nr:hypothetical protein [Ornithinimicrobium avium]AXH95813.1 hypothetical protein DV701_06440 [Ornithinimicrobium avium]
MDRPQPGTGVAPARPAASRAAALAALDDLQDAAADLGMDEATGLVDAVVDDLGHLLVDLAEGSSAPTPRPRVVGAIGGPARPVDHASCRVAAAALGRVSAVLAAGAPVWAPPAGVVAEKLADLLIQVADTPRGGQLSPSARGLVVRRVNALSRRLRSLG